MNRKRTVREDEGQAKPLDADKERERLEPGLNTAGAGEAGADPARRKGGGNSNT